MPMLLSIIALLLYLSVTVKAEIILDHQSLPVRTDNVFDIQQGLGQTVGNNLFHTFDTFNLNAGETARFSGAEQIHNLISRVVGGQPSFINGTIQSTIPGADFYFLNPYGVLFGESAKLDVDGSFHVSTADYLKLSDGGEFHARFPERDLLTTAPVASFGFLTDSPASISARNSKLSVKPNQQLSLIGGDIHLDSDVPLTVDNLQLYIPATIEGESILATEHGQVNLVSVASQGEATVQTDAVTVSTKGGNITLKNTFVDVNGYSEESLFSGGAVYIRGGKLVIDDSVIQSRSLAGTEQMRGNQGKIISVKMDESVYLHGISTELLTDKIYADKQTDSVPAGSVFIVTPYLEIVGAVIATGAFSEGVSGNIMINASNLLMKDGAAIEVGSVAADSGDIVLDVKERISLSGHFTGERIRRGVFYVNQPTFIAAAAAGGGDTGDVIVNTTWLDISKSSIGSEVYVEGRPGTTDITAKKISMANGAEISNTNFGNKNPENARISIKADSLYMTGKSLLPYVFGILQSGNPDQMMILDTYNIKKTSIESSSKSTGNGSNINIQANEIFMLDSAEIIASGKATGKAGNIVIRDLMDDKPFNIFYMNSGLIATDAAPGAGNGGNIVVTTDQFVVLDNARIIADAEDGNGGNITIMTDNFLASPNSLLSASSALGIDGEVFIAAPEQSISGDAVLLSSELTDLSDELIARFCRVSDLSELSTFRYSTETEGRIRAPQDFLE